jgi:hypothetical protein
MGPKAGAAWLRTADQQSGRIDQRFPVSSADLPAVMREVGLLKSTPKPRRMRATRVPADGPDFSVYVPFQCAHRYGFFQRRRYL